MSAPRGFALIVALWLIVALAAIVGLATGTARLGQQTTINRLALTRGRWAAEACLAIAEARWAQGRLADSASVDLSGQIRCALRVGRPAARLDANTADSTELASVVCVARPAPCGLDSLLAVRRSAPLTDLAQVAPIPGLDSASLRLLTVDGPGTVDVNAAPPAVLLALPGMSPEAVARIEDRRQAGHPYGSLDALVSDLSPPTRAVLLARYSDLARQTVFSAPVLTLTAQGWIAGQGGPDGLHAAVELLVVPLPGRLATVRRRMW